MQSYDVVTAANVCEKHAKRYKTSYFQTLSTQWCCPGVHFWSLGGFLECCCTLDVSQHLEELMTSHSQTQPSLSIPMRQTLDKTLTNTYFWLVFKAISPIMHWCICLSMNE